ncbi:MAG: ribonucleotide-diphosphate reductase subunit beta, partial [Alphaproteobacteria bacterium]|nr:ribonucleotide-diphosphate reductase subunit beta [Alphaproteobacteria bacterium]
AYSMRDETLHTESIIQLYHTFLDENPQIDRAKLNAHLQLSCTEIVKMEDAFIDLSFEMGAVEGMTPDDIKLYIRYMADIRLQQLHLKPEYNVQEHPLPWLEESLGIQEHANFFESRATEYSLAATRGEWSDVFDDVDQTDLLTANPPKNVDNPVLPPLVPS